MHHPPALQGRGFGVDGDRQWALFDVETHDGPMRTLYRNVRDNLLGDLTPGRFADVYAQTMVYGLSPSDPLTIGCVVA